MSSQHTTRILSLIDNPTFFSVPFAINSRHYPRGHKHRTQWKWFLRDIGKQSCVVALLPFVEEAKYIWHTPLVEGFYPVDKHEDDSTFHTKAALITEWAAKPSTAKKREIISILPPANHHLRYDVVISGASPNAKCTAFINWLVLIIVTERHFDTRVLWALDCLVDMGYNPLSVTLFFQKNLRQHYENKQRLSE